jgi:hypothetical protein
MLENVQGLKAVVVRLDGGIDEESAADSLLPEDSVKMTNWRLSRDGKRIQKRAGLDEEGLVAAEDVYGYATYTNSGGDHCQLAALEGQLMRKVGAGAWTQIYDWPSSATIDHTVRILEIQDKQFIITEHGSRVVLSDGNVAQVGVSPPTTLPTAVPSAIAGVSAPLNEYMVYANQAAMNAVWTDSDAGTGASTWTVTPPDSTPGPDADANYMRLLVTPENYANIARRYRTIAGYVGKKYGMDLAVYMNVAKVIGYNAGMRGLHLFYDDGERKLHFALGTDGLYSYSNWGPSARLVAATIPINKWLRIKFNVEKVQGSFTTNLYKINATITWDTGTAFGEIQTSPAISTAEGYLSVGVYSWGDYYIDHILIATEEELSKSSLTGTYKYAVSYIRGTNYICESNALKAAISSVTFGGIGLNDMTVDPTSVFTGAGTVYYKVEIDLAISTPDTIRWSEDNGESWKVEDFPITTEAIALSNGIKIIFAAVDGHTLTASWTFTATVPSARVLFEGILLASIPTSSDTTVSGRKIYRTTADGSDYFYLTTIWNNTATTYVDSLPDSALGDILEEDHDLFTEASTTIGKFSEWWDQRLWIADHVENVVYYSGIREGGAAPCEFDIANRFIPINKGDQDDTITALFAYKDALYVFKRNDIFIIQKTSLGYGVYHLNSDLGCVADQCVTAVNDYLMFPSEKGIELYDGVRSFHPAFSVAVTKTFLTADPAGYKYMSIAHDKLYNEVWLSIPSRLSGAAAITIVWNYIRNKFYFFQFHKTPSVLSRCRDSTGASVLKMGTRDGYVCLCDYGYADESTPITATYRKGWFDVVAHGIGRMLQTDYELPAGMTITMNVYVDQQSAVARTAALAGDTPGATDIEIRRVISDKTELGQRMKYLSIEYVNAQNCGGDCKINGSILYARPDVVKNKVSPN